MSCSPQYNSNKNTCYSLKDLKDIAKNYNQNLEGGAVLVNYSVPTCNGIKRDDYYIHKIPFDTTIISPFKSNGNISYKIVKDNIIYENEEETEIIVLAGDTLEYLISY